MIETFYKDINTYTQVRKTIYTCVLRNYTAIFQKNENRLRYQYGHVIIFGFDLSKQHP
jgi:hypothetical protein